MSTTFKITGKCRAGRETASFDANLRDENNRILAKLSSYGDGGCARIDWDQHHAPKGSSVRAAAQLWLAQEAERLWIEFGYEAHEDVLKAWPDFEAAIMVVPEHVHPAFRKARAS